LYRVPEHRQARAGGRAGRGSGMTAVEDAPATAAPTAENGNARARREDRHLVTGRTTWVDNMTVPGMVHLAILRSPMAHATITSIDVSEAKTRPGVLAVFTGQDFAETQGNLPCAWPVTPDMVNPGAPSLAGTGEPIQGALDSAEVTVKRRFLQQRLIPAFMEPRSTLVQPVGEGVLVHSSTQIPHILRTMLALTLGIEEQKVRVVAPDVGGG